jgi:hypothetical protein
MKEMTSGHRHRVSTPETAGTKHLADPWPRAKFIVRSDGTVFSLADLPATGTRRWIMRRKADVVEAVNGGLITVEDACWRYVLTMDEFLSWQIAVERFGIAGLNAQRAQHDRRADRKALALQGDPRTFAG